MASAFAVTSSIRCSSPTLVQSQVDLGGDDDQYLCWAGLILMLLCLLQLFEDHQET